LKNFDERIRDKLFDAEMPVSDGIWDVIEQNLERKDNRPTRWFFLMTLLMGLPALFYSYYLVTGASDRSLDASSNTDQLQSRFLPTGYFDDDERLYSYADYSSLAPLQEIGQSQPATPESADYSDEKLHLGFQIASGKKNKKVRDIAVQALESESGSKLFRPASMNSTDDALSHDIDRLFANRTGCPDFKPRWPGFFIYGQAGSHYPFTQLSGNTAELNALVEQRRLTESGLPSFSIEAGAGYEFNNGLFVQAGIMYNQTNIKFLHREEDVINNTTSIVIDTIFNSEGDIIAINKDTTVVQQTGVRELKSTNTFSMIDIPVSIGIVHPLNNKFSLRASAGVIFNLRMRTSGYMVDYEGEPYEYSDDMNPMFKTRAGLSYQFAVGLETKITDRFCFDAGLNMRHFSRNINLESNPVNQAFLNIGLTAGVRYRI